MNSFLEASIKSVTSALVFFISLSSAFGATTQWTPKAAQDWQRKAGWIVGANYVPASAVNQIEMWQAETFDPERIDRELGWAAASGMTSLRVFLHDLVWQKDPAAYAQRIERFLALAAKHKIKPMIVLFDSCWNPRPHLAQQPAPTPGVHNSQWVQGPGIDAVIDMNQRPRLRAYVTGVMKAFANDSRILAWDLWNEPDNLNSASYNESAVKLAAVSKLLKEVFQWARSADVDQPLTSGVWTGDWTQTSTLTPIQETQLSKSDVITFHSYDAPTVFENRIAQLKRYKRPILCTEYMARPFGNRVETILPIAKAQGVSAYNWGFVAGRSQTYFPWDSWQNPYPAMPPIWFHDLYYDDGRAYDPAEIAFLKKITQ